MSANQTQIGGSHYKTGGLEHWDFVAQNNLNYYEAAATKYVARSRKKNGLEDVKKSRHYVDKLLELWEAKTGWQKFWATVRNDVVSPADARNKRIFPVDDLARLMGLSLEESALIEGISTWEDADDLREVLWALDQYISDLETEAAAKATSEAEARGFGETRPAVYVPNEDLERFHEAGHTPPIG